ncbi:MAG: NADH:ubiquinone oxidoreductase, partial [Planctomycetota bacterium]
DKKEFIKCLTELLAGKTPEIPNYSVCVECKLRENECVFEKNLFCLGPVTRAGCEARCPSSNWSCEGCRGLVDNPNVNAEKDVLQKYGLTIIEALDKFKMFQGYYDQIKQ